MITKSGPLNILRIVAVVLLTASSCAPAKTPTSVGSKERDGSVIEASSAAASRDGQTFEKAIVVNSIREEYNWLYSKYPGAKVQRQALIRDNGKPYDVLTFVTADGESKSAYFDISSFFGKGF